MGGWGEIFELLAGEDVEGDQVDLGVAVLASLGGGHVDDFAWAALDDDEAVLSQGGALHRVGDRRASIAGRVEGVLMLKIECQLPPCFKTQPSASQPHAQAQARPQFESTYLGIVVLRHVEQSGDRRPD